MIRRVLFGPRSSLVKLADREYKESGLSPLGGGPWKRLVAWIREQVLWIPALAIISAVLAIAANELGGSSARFRLLFPQYVGRIDSIRGSLGLLLGVPLLILGIVVPLVILAVQFWAGHFNVVGRYLKKVGVLRLVSWLGITIVAVACSHVSLSVRLVSSPVRAWSLLLICGIMCAASLLEATLVLRKLVTSLNRSHLFAVAAELIREAGAQSMEAERRLQYIRNRQDMLLNEMGLFAPPVPYLGGWTVLASAKTGYVVDIDLASLKKLVSNLKSSTSVRHRAIVAKGVGDWVEDGEPLVIVGHGEEKLARLRRLAERAFVVGDVGMLPREPRDLLTQLSGATVEAIQGQDVAALSSCLKVYEEILGGFGQGPVPEPERLKFRPRWRLTEWAIIDLHRIIRLAAQGEDTLSVSLGFHLWASAKRVMQSGDAHAFRGVLDLFLGLCSEGLRYGNKVAIHTSYYYLTDYLVERDIVPQLGRGDHAPQVIGTLLEYLDGIASTLNWILRRLIDGRDISTYGEVLDKHKHLLDGYYPDVEAINGQIEDLQSPLESDKLTDAEREAQEKQMETLRRLLGLREAHHEIHRDVSIWLAAYICERYRNGKLDSDECHRAMAPIRSFFGGPQEMLNSVSAILQSNIRLADVPFMMAEDDGHDQNRRLDHLCLWVYCLEGALASEVPDEGDFLAPVLAEMYIEKIRDICQEILSRPSQWEWYLNGNIAGVEMVLALHESIVD